MEEESSKNMTNMERTSIQALCRDFGASPASVDDSDSRKEECMKEKCSDDATVSNEVRKEIREGALTLIQLKYHNPDSRGGIGPRMGRVVDTLRQ